MRSNTPKQVIVQRITHNSRDLNQFSSTWIAQDFQTLEVLAQSKSVDKKYLLQLVEEQGWKVAHVLNDWN